MAVKVTPARAMNTIGAKTYEEATSYKRDAAGYLTILQGTKKVADHAAGSWESVEVLTLLDAKPVTDVHTEKELGKVKAPKKVGGRAKAKKKSTVTREGAQIRTSPVRGDKL